MGKSILLISGPSGIGKSYLAKKLASNSNYEIILPTTTRKIRDGEYDGIDYEFLTKEEYCISKEEFFMDNFFFDNFYGIRKSNVEDILAKGKIPIGIIYTPVISQFLDFYPESFPVFLYPKNINLLRENLLRRDGDLSRYKSALKELIEYDTSYNKYYKKIYYIESNEDNDFIINEINNHFSIYS